MLKTVLLLMQKSRPKRYIWAQPTPGDVYAVGQGGSREIEAGRGLFRGMSIYECKSSNYIPTHTHLTTHLHTQLPNLYRFIIDK